MYIGIVLPHYCSFTPTNEAKEGFLMSHSRRRYYHTPTTAAIVCDNKIVLRNLIGSYDHQRNSHQGDENNIHNK